MQKIKHISVIIIVILLTSCNKTYISDTEATRLKFIHNEYQEHQVVKIPDTHGVYLIKNKDNQIFHITLEKQFIEVELEYQEEFYIHNQVELFKN